MKMRFGAILGGLILGAAPALAMAQSTLTVSVAPTVALTNADFVYVYNNGSGFTAAYNALGTLPAAQTSTFHFSSPANPGAPLDFSIAGQYGGGLSAGGGVIVALPAVQANDAVGKSWNTFFAVGPGTSTNNMFIESAIDNALAEQNASLLFLFNSYAGPADAISAGTTGDLVTFTSGTLAGSVSVSAAAVPEPASICLLAIAGAGMMRRRSKCRTNRLASSNRH